MQHEIKSFAQQFFPFWFFLSNWRTFLFWNKIVISPSNRRNFVLTCWKNQNCDFYVNLWKNEKRRDKMLDLLQIWRGYLARAVELSFKHLVRTFIVIHKKFRQINSLVFSVVKTLLSRNFCQRSVTINFRNFHTVHTTLLTKISWKK